MSRTALATPPERSIMGGHLSIDFFTSYLYEATHKCMPSKPHGKPLYSDQTSAHLSLGTDLAAGKAAAATVAAAGLLEVQIS